MSPSPLVLPGRSFYPSPSLGSVPPTDVPTVPAGTFAIALGVSQGADHHLPTSQAVAGVDVAQATLGMDVLSLNDLERGKEWHQDLTGLGDPPTTPPLPYFPYSYLLTPPSSLQDMDTTFPGGIWRTQSGSFCSAARQSRSDC